jgi:ERCC4-related helicase
LLQDTRDEANFYIARKKERKMKEILKGMQDNATQDAVSDIQETNGQATLTGF